MKKTLPIIFSLALISCSFTACGDKDKNSGANGTTKAPTMAVDETSGLNSATDASMDAAGETVRKAITETPVIPITITVMTEITGTAA